jgi:glycosyltransferase XagB
MTPRHRVTGRAERFFVVTIDVLGSGGLVLSASWALRTAGNGRDILDERAVRFRARALHRAVYALDLKRPAYSARSVVTGRQVAVLLASASLLLCAWIAWPVGTSKALVAAMSLGFLGSLTFRTTLAAMGRRARRAPCSAAEGEDLPVYTVLAPLYREAGMLAQLAEALGALDYPREKLDLKFIVEEDDEGTRAAAEALGQGEVIVVPFGLPRTKPKACNFALHFARGEFVVIYDAEDRPEPDQLRKAVAAFRASADVACFQARLAIENGNRAWVAGGIMAQTPLENIPAAA